MNNLVPIKVKIGLKPAKRGKSHSYPDFNSIRDKVESWSDDSDWSFYIDKYGGWIYDSICGHADDDSVNGSPQGVWLGMLCVPEDFARESALAFPFQVSVMSEAECQSFYEGRCTITQPEIREDVDVLQAIAAKRAAGITADSDDENALNPDTPHRGRRRNKTKTWGGYKQQRGIQIDTAATERLRNMPQR